MKRLPNETLLEFTLRFLSEHAMPSGKRTQQAAQCDENRKFAAFSNQGEAQPVARLLENSEDIAEQYARPVKVSEREKAGSRKEHSPQVRIPAPKKYFEMLRVDTACETIFDSNRWGDQVCLREGVGICKFCGSIVCQPCVTLECCPNAPCGQSKHLVIVQ